MNNKIFLILIHNIDNKNIPNKTEVPPYAIAYDFLTVAYPNEIESLPLETSKCRLIM
jgi:hypothetical protein